MASQYLARLGVILGIDTAQWEADINQAIAANQTLKREISKNSRDAAKEIERMTWAVKDYGRQVSASEKLEREFLEGGKFARATDAMKTKLRELAKQYDDVAASKKKAFGEQIGMLGGMQGGQLNQRQLAALGYQTTDILTGLASGQNPMMVLIQQGGQLRDQFGGFIPLFKAIGSVLTATRLIVGGLAGGIAALAYAAYQGKEEFKEFRNSLALTNNIAGLTFTEIYRLRDALANNLNISLSDSRAIFLELVKSGKFTTQTMESVANVIGNVARLSGEAADVVAKDLIPSFNGTASAAKTLNDRFNFLTASQYRQIELLELSGKKQEAAKLTADLLNKSIERQKEVLEITEGWWSKLTRTMSNWWEIFKQIGVETEQDKLAKLGERIQFLNKELLISIGKGLNDKGLKNALEQAQKDYIDFYNEMMKKRQEIEANAAKQGEQNRLIDNYIAAGGEQKRQDILANIKKLQADREFQEKVFGLNEFQRIEAEAERKNQDALNEMIKANIDERYVFAETREQEYQQKVLRNELEKRQKIEEISRKAAIEVEKEQQTRLNGVYTEQEKLQIYERNLFISDKDYKIALNRLKAEQEIARIRANQQLTPEAQQAAIEREKLIERRSNELAELEERLKHLKDVSASVWSNMETALTNFVRTGKFQFKDFARSVIQDILTIYMRAQMLQMFNMGKSFLGSFMGGSMYTDASGMFQVGMALADGGEPPVGKVSLVGERGPELFIPKTAGTIIPNHELGNLGGPQIVYNGPYIASMSAIDTQSAVQFLAQNKQAVYAANLSASRSLPASR